MAHDYPFLRDLVVLFAAAVAVALAFHRLRLPGLAGLIVTGALLGPAGLGVVRDTALTSLLAEVGVVLLLFTIGLEFSVAELRRLAGVMLRLGAPQVLLSVGLVALAAVFAGVRPGRAAFYGFLAALSSTAIVMQALAERGETDAPHGRATIGALLLQDLCVVPMMLVLPMLAGEGGRPPDVLLAVAKAVVLVALALALARLVIPRGLELVARTRQRDVFVLAVLVVCAGVAWLTSLLGLSLALGAFLGGVVLADSEYGHQALSDVLPLRSTFASLFFISIGMLFDRDTLVHHAGLVAALAAGVLAAKALLVAGIALLAGMPVRVAILSGVALAQVGEFSFVLASQGARLGLLDADGHRAFLAASVLTMAITPLALRLGPRLAAGATRLGLRDRPLPEPPGAPADAQDLADHVVILGFGLAGRLLAGALRRTGIRYTIVDIDADRVRSVRELGEPAAFGDVTAPEVLERARVGQARHVVLVLNDPNATRRAVRAVQHLARDVPITVRSRYLAETADLEKAGATDVVAQEFEATIEIIARVLRVASVPGNVIADRLHEAREEGGRGGRPLTIPRRQLGEIRELTGLKIETFLVQEEAWIAGRTVAGSELRSRTGVTIVAVGHQGAAAVHPAGSQVISPGDVLYLVGDRPELAEARILLEDGPETGE